MGLGVGVGLGPFRLIPGLGINFTYHKLSVDIDDETFRCSKWKVGLFGGVEAALSVNELRFFCGINKTYTLGNDASFLVNDEIKFEGEIVKAPREIYFGIGTGFGITP